MLTVKPDHSADGNPLCVLRLIHSITGARFVIALEKIRQPVSFMTRTVTVCCVQLYWNRCIGKVQSSYALERSITGTRFLGEGGSAQGC
jgi:hypothetical protein